LIEYRVRLADASRHWFEVDCHVEIAGEIEDFELPSWIPGSYLLREYAQHVVRAEAFGSRGESIEVEKIAHNVWRCKAHSRSVTLRLVIYALDESVRGAWFDAQRAWFNGPCLFVRARNQPDTAVRLILEVPGVPLDKWQVASAMAAVAVDARGFGEYRAADYDELLDHPFVIGDIDRVEFEAGGVPHSLVVLGRHDGDLERVAEDLRRLCGEQIAFFGALPPFEHYFFLCLIVADGYGGLEHRCSSVLMFDRTTLPGAQARGMTKSYQRMLSLASHEYFHTWHVKRSKPAAFTPYRLSERNLTRLLWVFEGITSYYQDRFLLRCGLIDEQAYLERLSELISGVLRVPGRQVQSLSESSFDAWDKLYKPNANSPNAGVSYYSKGALVALALDLEIRRRHDSRIALDDVVLALWREFGARNIGLPEDGFERLAKRLAGEELTEFFDRTIRGTSDLPLVELFADLAIDLVPVESESVAWLGIISQATSEGVECVTVLDGGPAQAAGLNPGDIIIALHHMKVTSANMNALLNRFGIGAEIPVSFFRGDELLESVAVPGPAPPQSYRLCVRESEDERQHALRRGWLGE
jgi:predicted metalloprotease with PDZ domain